MGTNYYAIKSKKPPCEHCGREYDDPRLHIGKSSGGWCFSLHVIPEEGLNSLDDWKRYLTSGDVTIEDEYGTPRTFEELMQTITERGRRDPLTWSDEMLDRNHAIPGPNNLVRHRIDQYCCGHGEGTWDLITGNFS